MSPTKLVDSSGEMNVNISGGSKRKSTLKLSRLGEEVKGQSQTAFKSTKPKFTFAEDDEAIDTDQLAMKKIQSNISGDQKQSRFLALSPQKDGVSRMRRYSSTGLNIEVDKSDGHYVRRSSKIRRDSDVDNPPSLDSPTKKPGRNLNLKLDTSS